MDTCDAGRERTERTTIAAGSPTMDTVLAHLEAVIARLDQVEAENAAQAEEIARLKGAPAAVVAAPIKGPASKVGRRRMLRKILGATAAAALLTMVKEATTAEADTRTTLIPGGASTSNYGLVSVRSGTFDPSLLLPDLGSSTFGVIGIESYVGIAPPASAGVLGLSAGINEPGPLYSGVLGLSQYGLGVFGQSTGYFGVHGTSTNYVGVGGLSPNLYGVWGLSNTSIGVRGDSTGGIGVYGESTNNYGCGGATSKPGFAGLFGYASVASAAGFLGVNGAPGGTAGYFHGAVTVDGPFQVVNGPKNALVAHPDGSHRRMYCQESPEPWFEDFGTAQLQAGKATVRLDPDFAAVVKADQYSVFPIPEGACEGVYIAAKTPNSFEVRELRGGTNSVPFSYRLVARRKDDVGRRMEKVELPKMAPIDVEQLTRPVETPARPVPPKRPG